MVTDVTERVTFDLVLQILNKYELAIFLQNMEIESGLLFIQPSFPKEEITSKV
jgi:hypothetical protein